MPFGIQFVLHHLLAVVVADVVRSWGFFVLVQCLSPSRQRLVVVCLVQDIVNVRFRVVDQFQGQTSEREVGSRVACKQVASCRPEDERGESDELGVQDESGKQQPEALAYRSASSGSHDGERGDWWIG